MPMAEALKHRRRYGCEFRGGLLHADLCIRVRVVISNRKVVRFCRSEHRGDFGIGRGIPTAWYPTLIPAALSMAVSILLFRRPTCVCVLSPQLPSTSALMTNAPLLVR